MISHGSAKMRMSYGLNAFRCQTASHEPEVAIASNASQHACHDMYACFRSFSASLQLLRCALLALLSMPRRQQTCCICNKTIQTPSNGRTVTAKQYDRLKPYLCGEITVGTDRGHISCVQYPHKHAREQVRHNNIALHSHA